MGAKAADNYVGVCEVVFECDSTLHAFHGDITNLVVRAVCETNAAGDAVLNAEIEIRPRQLSTHNQKRDEHMYAMFQSDRFPKLFARVTHAPLATARLSPDPTSAKPGTMPLQLTFCGITRAVEARTSHALTCPDGWDFDLTTEVSLKAFQLHPPSGIFGALSVRDSVRIRAHVKVRKESPRS